MKYKIGIEGLDCPNCAKALENEFNKIDNINNANIDFINQKLSFETDNFDLSIQKMKNTISQVEPSAKLIIEKEKKKTELTWVYDVVLLFLGIAVGLCALLISMPTWAFWLLFVISAVLLGYKTYLKAVLLLFKGKINENLLITLAVIGAAALGDEPTNLYGLNSPVHNRRSMRFAICSEIPPLPPSMSDSAYTGQLCHEHQECG